MLDYLDYNVVKKGFDQNSLPLTLDIIKTFLKIDPKQTDQDAFLTKLNMIATQYAENCTQQSILKNKFLITFRSISVKVLLLPFKPIINVEKIKLYKKSSPTYTELIEGKGFFVRVDSATIVFLIKLPRGDRVEILFNSGPDKVDDVPYQIKDGILMHIYMIYNRTDTLENLNTVNSLYSGLTDIKILL